MSTTTTTFNLTVITDDSIAKNHLGAAEMLNRSWCGVQLLIEGDTRFGGRYAGMVWKTVTTEDGKPNFELMSCGACKRSAAWKVAGSTGEAVYTVAPKGTRARREPVAVPGDQARPDAAELADLAAQAAAAAAANGDSDKPSRRKRKAAPPAANEQQEADNRDAGTPARKRRKSAADRANEQLAADQETRAAALAAAEANAAQHIDGSLIVETDPDTGLPRIRPDVQARADEIVAEQLAANEALINEVIDGGTEGGQ